MMITHHVLISWLDCIVEFRSDDGFRQKIKPKSIFVSLIPCLKVSLRDFLKLLILLISDSFPELWEVPLVDYNSKDGRLCNIIDSCTPPILPKKPSSCLIPISNDTTRPTGLHFSCF